MSNNTSGFRFIRRIFYPQALWLKTDGNRIVNEKGEVAILRGVNIGSSHWGYENWHSKAVKKAVKDWNSKIIRVRLYPEDIINDPNFFFDLEKQFINPARHKGVYVILHAFLEGSETDLPDEETIEMWLKVVERYKNEPLVLYDLIPEPHDVSQEQVRQAYLDLIPKIRKIHPRSLILVTGVGWAREINSYLKNPLPFENLVYRVNPYNRVGEFEGLFGKIALKYPVFITEFGKREFPPMNERDIQVLLDYANQLNLGWTVWNFHSEGCPCVLASWQDFTPSDWGQLIYDELKKEPQVQTLAEANPVFENPSELVIFQDYFYNGFTERGWDREIDLHSSENPFHGDYGIKLELKKPYSGATFMSYNPVDLGKYSFLQFYLNFSKNSPFKLKIDLRDKDDQVLGETEINQYLLISQGNWYLAEVPLKDFLLGDKGIVGIGLKETSGESHQPIFIDEIRVLK